MFLLLLRASALVRFVLFDELRQMVDEAQLLVDEEVFERCRLLLVCLLR
jgi:hypothetical protein